MTDLTVETRRTDPVASLIPFADAHRPLLFLRRGDGIAGIGEALRLEFHGPTRLTDAADAWREVAATAEVSDEVKVGGSADVIAGQAV